MKIPKKIKIGPHTYKIKYQKGMSKNHSVLGQTRMLDGVIAIDPEQIQTQLEDTFIHEILHAINMQVEFVNRDRDVEESAIIKLSPLLLQIIKENKEIFK